MFLQKTAGFIRKPRKASGWILRINGQGRRGRIELAIGINEITSTPYKEGEKFFGKDCNIIFTCDISGPTQDFKKERVVII